MSAPVSNRPVERSVILLWGRPPADPPRSGPTLPMSRCPPAVHHGENHHLRFIHDVEHSKWKSTNHGTPYIARYPWVQIGMLGNRRQGPQHFVQELRSKPRPLRFIPSGCIGNVGLGFRPQANGHSSARILSIASSAGAPGSFEIRYASSLLSSSLRCSSETARTPCSSAMLSQMSSTSCIRSSRGTSRIFMMFSHPNGRGTSASSQSTPSPRPRDHPALPEFRALQGAAHTTRTRRATRRCASGPRASSPDCRSPAR